VTAVNNYSEMFWVLKHSQKSDHVLTYNSVSDYTITYMYDTVPSETITIASLNFRFRLTEIGRYLQPPDTFPWLKIRQKCVFGWTRAHCLMTTIKMSFPRCGKLTVLPQVP